MPSDPISELREDVRDLKEWAARHEDEHNADKRLLSSLIGRLAEHQTNHHGTATRVKQGGLVAATAAVLVALAELLNRFL